MKLIIDIEKDYYEMLKYNVEHGQKYKPFEVIANGIPYEEKPLTDKISSEDFIKAFGGGSSMPDYHEMREGQEFYGNGYKQGYADAKAEFERPKDEWTNTSPYDDKGECPFCCYLSKKYYKFCPNCGADMRGGES